MLERRVFVEANEAPALVLGALRGDPVALRRILGARRGGRIGVVAGALALAIAAPPRAWLALGAAHMAVALGVWAATRQRTGLAVREVLRVSLWPAFPLVALAATLRLVWPDAAWPALAAILAAGALVFRALSRGLDGP
jgi:hypothetical protein